MISVALVVSTILSIVSGIVYLLLGRVVSRREVPGPMRSALRAFAMWWYLLGVISLLSPVSVALGEAGVWTLPAYLTYTQTVLLVILAALAGLVYYLVYVYTGSSRAWVWVLVGYSLFYIAILGYFNAADPIGLTEGPNGGVQMEYANDLEDTVFATVLGLLLLLPPIAAAVAYLSLLRRVKERSQRFRIGAVALAFIIWFGTSLIGGQILGDAFTSTIAWRIITGFVALLGAFMVYTAFRPPDWVRRVFRIEGFDSKQSEPPS